LAFLLAAATEPPRPGPWPPRTYPCLRASGAIEIDGRVDEPAWEAAPWTESFVDIEGDRRPPPRLRTRACMLWDEAFFYIAAEMEEPHLWATLRQRDSIIYHDNDFEVFIDPDGDSHLYSEIELNAFNTVWDLLLVRPYRDGGPAIHAWDIPGLRTAVHLDGSLNDASDVDRAWSVEIAIPFAVLDETTDAPCPPADGDRWRVNFSRVQWQLDVSGSGYAKSLDPGTGKPYPEDNWVWSPQRQIAMHEPEYWGIVEFRAATDSPAARIEPTPMDAGAWCLRYASYHLADYFVSHRAFPGSFQMPTLPAAAPDLDDHWTWPPTYWSDGVRYTLTLRRGNRLLSLTEDGCLRILAME
jgi:hypothetical protein